MSVVATGALHLTEVRAAAGAALAPQLDTDPNVYEDLVDAIDPPALLLLYADPWLARRVVGGKAMGGTGYWDTWLEVICCAGRADPAPSLGVCEELVAYVLSRFTDDARDWPVETFYAPRNFLISGITYLGARMIFRVPVTV
jgi:hypothetical protein